MSRRQALWSRWTNVKRGAWWFDGCLAMAALADPQTVVRPTGPLGMVTCSVCPTAFGTLLLDDHDNSAFWIAPWTLDRSLDFGQWHPLRPLLEVKQVQVQASMGRSLVEGQVDNPWRGRNMAKCDSCR